MRVGVEALSMLANPLTVPVVTALKDGPRGSVDLRREAGLPPQTTMRGQLRVLSRTDVVERYQQAESPKAFNYNLGSAGRELLKVSRALDSWLARSPKGEVSAGTATAKSLIRALAQGWSSSIVRALASTALTLSELNKLIASLNYPSLERRMSALRSAGLIEPAPAVAGRKPYRASVWLRQAIAPLAAAARWERRYAAEETAPIGRIDIETAFLLPLPMLEMPTEVEGGCRLAVEAPSKEGGITGVTARFSGGGLESCVTRLEGKSDAGICGTAIAWIDAVEDADPGRLELSGDRDLAYAIVKGMHDFSCGPA